MKKRGETKIPEPFELTPATLAWLATKYPQVDAEETRERFECSAHAHGWMYANWQMAFQTIVRRGIDNGWRSIVTIKGGVANDPKWTAILTEANQLGFRVPHKTETLPGYRTAFDIWKREQRYTNNVVSFSGVLKKVG